VRLIEALLRAADANLPDKRDLAADREHSGAIASASALARAVGDISRPFEAHRAFAIISIGACIDSGFTGAPLTRFALAIAVDTFTSFTRNAFAVKRTHCARGSVARFNTRVFLPRVFLS